MKIPPWVQYAGLLISSYRIVHSWVIDEASCGPRGDPNANPPNPTTNDKVRIALQSAFDMMQQTDRSLQDWDHADPNIKNVYSWIFTDQNAFGTVKDVVHKFTDPVVTAERQNMDGYKQDTDEIIIYCDMRRVQKYNTYGVDRFWDHDIDRPINNWDEGYRVCMESTDPPKSGPNAIQAYALSAKDFPTQITLCQWYVKQMLKEGPTAPPYATNPNTKQKVLAWLSNTVWRTLGPGRPKIDTLALLDQTLAHEFTHTWQVGWTNSNDADKDEAYGWNKVTSIDWGQRNADSYATFGLAVRIINDPSPMIVQKDGNLKSKDNSQRRKRWADRIGIPWTA